MCASLAGQRRYVSFENSGTLTREIQSPQIGRADARENRHRKLSGASAFLLRQTPWDTVNRMRGRKRNKRQLEMNDARSGPFL